MKCIKISVEGPSFDVTVCHISSLTSFLLTVEQMVVFKLKRKKDNVFSPIIYCHVNVIGKFQTKLGQPYVHLTSKSKITTRKETLLS